MSSPRVTVAIPVYKRLRFLPGALASVAAQDYPELELLVSDNGENGPEVEALVREHYSRPFRFRRNETTEPVMSRHFNQMLESATGDFFVLLCDDDEIGPGFVRRLADLLDSDPEIGAALPSVQVMDEEGHPAPRAYEPPPRVFSFLEFLRMWVAGGRGFWNFATMMARREEMLAVGGYPAIPEGDDDAMVLKLTLGRKVGFDGDAVFRNRWYESGAGLSLSPWELAGFTRRWLRMLDEDPVLNEFGARRPQEWREARGLMIQKAWRGYRHRWKSMYRARLGTFEWIRAGFALPFIPAYYGWLLRYLVRGGLASVRARLPI